MWSMARRFAMVTSQAPGLSGTPVFGHCSSAATSASWANSSAWPTSPTMRATPPTTRAHSMRQTASTVRLGSVITPLYAGRPGPLGSRPAFADVSLLMTRRVGLLLERDRTSLDRGRHGRRLAGPVAVAGPPGGVSDECGECGDEEVGHDKCGEDDADGDGEAHLLEE